MKNLLLVLLVPILNACANSALFFANTLARFDSYTLSAGESYGAHALNRLDVYQPKEKSKGTIVFFYGGCWGACTTYSREKYRFVAQAMTSLGYVVVIPDYRVYPEVLFPQMMDDSVAVVTWVNDNIERYDGTANNLFLMGHSSGGHIAAMLSVNERYLGVELHKNVRGFVGLAAPYDFIFDKPYLPKVFADMDYNESQPSYFIDGSEPPLLLLYGDKDDSVYMRNIVNMTNIVEKNGGRVEPHIYRGVNHVDILAALSIPYRGKYDVMNDIADFLQRQGK